MTYQEYVDYIHSDKWRQKREDYISIKKPTSCGSCRRPFQHHFNLHHLSYKHLGDEPLTDLIMLCPKCHERLHNSLKEARHKNPYLGVS